MIQTIGRFLIRLGRRLAPTATFNGHDVDRVLRDIREASGLTDAWTVRTLLAREESRTAERNAMGLARQGSFSMAGQVADPTPAVVTTEIGASGKLHPVVRGRGGAIEFGAAIPIDQPEPASTMSFADLNAARDLTKPLADADDSVEMLAKASAFSE